MNFKMTFLALATASALSACAAGPNGGIGTMGQNESYGTVGGAVLGGGAGAAIGCRHGGPLGCAVGTLGGAVLGGVVGNHVGAAYDERNKLRDELAARDRQAADLARQQALAAAPVGQQIAWNGQQQGTGGVYTVTKVGTDTTSGAYCREYQEDIIVGGKRAKGYGTACRQPDGSWRIVSQGDAPSQGQPPRY